MNGIGVQAGCQATGAAPETPFLLTTGVEQVIILAAIGKMSKITS
jgi:hypothetical protein